jgi:hypothetical protein
VKLVLNWGHFKKEIFSSKYEENIHIWWINEMTLSLNIIVASELLWQIYKPMERRYIIIFSKLFLIIYYSYLHRYISIHSYFIFLQLKSLNIHLFPSSKCPINFCMCKKNVQHEFGNKIWLILTSIDLYGTKAALCNKRWWGKDSPILLISFLDKLQPLAMIKWVWTSLRIISYSRKPFLTEGKVFLLPFVLRLLHTIFGLTISAKAPFNSTFSCKDYSMITIKFMFSEIWKSPLSNGSNR